MDSSYIARQVPISTPTVSTSILEGNIFVFVDFAAASYRSSCTFASDSGNEEQAQCIIARIVGTVGSYCTSTLCGICYLN